MYVQLQVITSHIVVSPKRTKTALPKSGEFLSRKFLDRILISEQECVGGICLHLLVHCTLCFAKWSEILLGIFCNNLCRCFQPLL